MRGYQIRSRNAGPPGGRVPGEGWAEVCRLLYACAWGQHAADWLAECDYYERAWGLTSPGLDAVLRIGRSAGWWWPLTNAVVLVERPATLHLDDNGDLHCPTGPALVYPGGWQIHAWHGTRVVESSTPD